MSGDGTEGFDHSDLYEAFDTDAGPVVAFLEWGVGRYGIRTPPTVLDVGCGPGRLLAPLAALGWDVVGMEPDPIFRVRAERTAKSLGLTEVSACSSGERAACPGPPQPAPCSP